MMDALKCRPIICVICQGPQFCLSASRSLRRLIPKSKSRENAVYRCKAIVVNKPHRKNTLYQKVLASRLHPQPQLIWISCGKLLYSTSEHDCTLCPTVSEDISARRPGEAMSASNPGEAMSALRPGCAIFVRPKRICNEQGKYCI